MEGPSYTGSPPRCSSFPALLDSEDEHLAGYLQISPQQGPGSRLLPLHIEGMSEGRVQEAAGDREDRNVGISLGDNYTPISRYWIIRVEEPPGLIPFLQLLVLVLLIKSTSKYWYYHYKGNSGLKQSKPSRWSTHSAKIPQTFLQILTYMRVCRGKVCS